MKVAILGINYSPEPTGIGPYTTRIAAGLAARGHEVTVFTGEPHYPFWKRQRSLRLRSEERIDGVRVRRFAHPVPRQPSWVGRAAMELVFGLQLLTASWGRPRVVICVVPPLLAAVMAVVRARLTWRGPAVGVLVQDMYGSGIREMGAASGSAARVMRFVESVALKSSEGISVIHGGFALDLNAESDIDARRIRVIRNWTHISAPDPSRSAAFRAAHGWTGDDLVVLHAGNMGYKQGLENVVAAASLASARDVPVRFVLLGDGNQRAKLEELAEGVSAIEFLAPVPERDFPSALGAADVLLVNERAGVSRTSVPSKLTSYFRSGKPIVAATDPASLTADELARSGAGSCIRSDRPDLLLSELIRLGSDPVLSQRLGDAGRRYCDEFLSEDAALDGYERWIVDLANSRRMD